jgi:hypothetical protein
MEMICVGILVMYCRQVDQPAAPTGEARFCEVAEPWYVEPGDSAATKRRAAVHNAKGLALCYPKYEKWRPPARQQAKQ